MNNKNSKETATEKARNYIRQKASKFEFYPGQSINELNLVEEIGVSRAPIREALNSLMCEGLIYFIPGKGFFCRKLSIREVSELFEIRLDMELAALKKVCEIATSEEIMTLLNKYREHQKTFDDIDEDALVKFDEEFHFHLLELARNSERIKFMENINVRIRFVRQINIETPDLKHKFLQDHIKILESIKDKDCKQAELLLKNHLGQNSHDLEDTIKEGLARIYGNDIGL